jgi:hypothetical protein
VRKGVVELTHVSKCGGTSMCQLAALNGCRCAAGEQAAAARTATVAQLPDPLCPLPHPCSNPDTSQLGNCLIKFFNDAPLWTVPTDFDWRNTTVNLRPYCVYKCDSYLRLYTRNCEQRSRWAPPAPWGTQLAGCLACHLVFPMRQLRCRGRCWLRRLCAAQPPAQPAALWPPRLSCIPALALMPRQRRSQRGCSAAVSAGCRCDPPPLAPSQPPSRVATTRRYLRQTKANFYSNERQLHGSSPNPATAHVCGDFYNVIILRDPLDHVQSLLLNTYINTLDFIQKRLFMPWLVGFKIPNDFDVWRRMAPAVVNNYYTRTLLGK